MNDETVYIFLDIDGVLNNDMARKKYRGTDMRMLNDNNLAELANLVNKINKHYLIVLISTWRYYIDNINILKMFLCSISKFVVNKLKGPKEYIQL